MDNKSQYKKNNTFLLVFVIAILIAGFFVYPEYQKYKTQKTIENKIASQEKAEKLRLRTEIIILENNRGSFEHSTDPNFENKSLEELINIKQELEWREEFEELKRKCGNDCPEIFTWNNFKLNKVFNE